ncbi:MAG: transporter ATP-binding protein [Acidimicrobiales bacterium]|nr:transporter ATP-binding protein [Acidimicrobiales bacterium]
MSESPAIEVVGVTKRFGDVVALDGVDLTVKAGTVYGLLGPNGAGKTTTVRILTTIIKPDTGSARVLGLDVVQQADKVRANIGLAGQYAAVDERLTGRENLRLVGRLTHQPKPVIEQRSTELLELFRLDRAADRVVQTYSGGMRRRLDLAASLVHRPPVLFLDEPTTGLDPRSRNDLWDLIRKLVADGTTLLLTTQYLEEADQLAERIAVVDSGHVIAEGTSAELKSRLGATVLEIAFPDAASAHAALATVQTIAPSAQVEGTDIRATVDHGPRIAMEVLRSLDAAGIEVGGLALREPSLDDVFLSLTGHKAEEVQETEEDDDVESDGHAGRRKGRTRQPVTTSTGGPP